MLEDLAADRNRGGLPGIVSRPSMTLRAVPLAAMEGRRLDAREVARAQLRFPPDANVRVESDSDGRQWWSNDPPRDVGAQNGESRWRTRLVRPGAMEFEATIGFREGDDPQIVVEGRRLEEDIVAGLERMGVALAELGLQGRTLVGITLDGVEDVVIIRARGGGRPMRRVQVRLPVADLDDLGGRFAHELREQFDILWQVAARSTARHRSTTGPGTAIALAALPPRISERTRDSAQPDHVRRLCPGAAARPRLRRSTAGRGLAGRAGMPARS